MAHVIDQCYYEKGGLLILVMHRQTDKQTDRQTDRHIDRQTDKVGIVVAVDVKCLAFNLIEMEAFSNRE